MIDSVADTSRDDIRETGGIAPIIECLQMTTDEATIIAAAHALSNLANTGKLKPVIKPQPNSFCVRFFLEILLPFIPSDSFL